MMIVRSEDWLLGSMAHRARVLLSVEVTLVSDQLVVDCRLLDGDHLIVLVAARELASRGNMIRHKMV